MEENNIMEQEAPQTEAEKNEEFEKIVEEQMTKLRTQSMLLGAQSACSVVLQKIVTAQSKGKMSYRDCERLIKDIAAFCKTGLSRKVNADGTTSPREEQNEIIEEEANE